MLPSYAILTTGKLLESDILSSLPLKLTRQLREWLPETGNWVICWRATTDGLFGSVFHSNCDLKMPTLTVVEVVKDSKTYVFGGFSTAPWDACM